MGAQSFLEARLKRTINYKQRLIRFMELKSASIAKHTDIPLLDNADWKELKSWSNLKCGDIVKSMLNEIENTQYEDLSDALFCPWCLEIKVLPICNCDLCDFGARHKVCAEKRSRYTMLRQDMSSENNALCTYLDIPKLLETLKGESRNELRT